MLVDLFELCDDARTYERQKNLFMYVYCIENVWCQQSDKFWQISSVRMYAVYLAQ